MVQYLHFWILKFPLTWGLRVHVEKGSSFSQEDCPGWHEILMPPGTFCPGSATGMGGIWCNSPRFPLRGVSIVYLFGLIFELEIMIDRIYTLHKGKYLRRWSPNYIKLFGYSLWFGSYGDIFGMRISNNSWLSHWCFWELHQVRSPNGCAQMGGRVVWGHGMLNLKTRDIYRVP